MLMKIPLWLISGEFAGFRGLAGPHQKLNVRLRAENLKFLQIGIGFRELHRIRHEKR